MAANEEEKTFGDLGICEQLAEACSSLGWRAPSRIQVEAIPHALQGSNLFEIICFLVFFFFFQLLLEVCFIVCNWYAGKDLIGLAQTGSGKTGAFALPILQALLEKPQPFFACVLSPTRFFFFFFVVFDFGVLYALFWVDFVLLFVDRELAIQIKDQFEALGSGIGVKCAVVSFLGVTVYLVIAKLVFLC